MLSAQILKQALKNLQNIVRQRVSKDSEINEFFTTVIPFLSTKRSGLYCTCWPDIGYGTSPFCLASRIRGKIKAEIF